MADVLDVQEFRVAVGRLARRMRQLYAADPGGPGFIEIAVLVRLAREGSASPGELAGREGVTPQAVAAALRQLEASGHVTRSRDAADGRVTRVVLTESGQALLVDREQVVLAALVGAVESVCTPDERCRLGELTELLDRLAAVM